MRADRHNDELLVHKVKHAEMYERILKYLFKGGKKTRDGKAYHQKANTFAFNNLKCGDYLSLKTQGKVHYDKSVLARRQIIVESHSQYFGGGRDYMLLKCA